MISLITLPIATFLFGYFVSIFIQKRKEKDMMILRRGIYNHTLVSTSTKNDKKEKNEIETNFDEIKFTFLKKKCNKWFMVSLRIWGELLILLWWQ